MTIPETMRVVCCHCEKPLKCPTKNAGRNVRCPVCKKEFVVPSVPRPVEPPLIQPVINMNVGQIPRKIMTKPKRTRQQNAMLVALLLVAGFFALFSLFLISATTGPEKYPGQREDLGSKETMVVIVFFGIACGIYTIPSFVAYLREHQNFVPIMVINIFFGWTLLGWVACLAWSFSSDIRESRQYVRYVSVDEKNDE